MSTKIAQKNMDNQNKKQKSPTNKHLEKKNKLTFKFGLKKFEGRQKLNGKACSFFHACKNMKGAQHQFGIEGATTTLKGCKKVLETKGTIVAL
jgi:hypothetical protein